MCPLFDLETEPSPQSLPSHLRRLVMIVEDDADQADLLEYRLKQLKYEVLRLNSGANVVETARKHLPDLILLDIHLPDASGLDVCSELADEAVTSAIPVVIVSGSDEPDVVKSARRAGSRFFLRKPYDPNTLVLIAEHAIQDSDRWML